MTSRSELPHVMVAGTRSFTNYVLLAEKMDRFTADLGELVVVTGEWRGIGYGTKGYMGADLLAEQWAGSRRFGYKRFPPEFEKFPGSKVGAFHARNREMVHFIAGLDEGFAVLFWDGESPGTRSVIELLREYDVQHKVVRY